MEQLGGGERFVRRITPQLGTHALVHPLGERLDQSIGERLEQDRGVVVVVGFEARSDLDLLRPGSDDESTDPVVDLRLDRRDVIGEAEVGAAVCLRGLLTDAVHASSLGGAGLVDVHHYVVAVGVGGPEANDSFRTEPVVGDDLVEHRERVVVERAGSVGELGIGEHLGELAANAPRAKERCPVDVGHEFGDVVVVEHSGADERRLGDGRVVERGVEAVGARHVDRHAITFDRCTGMRRDNTFVVGSQRLEEALALGAREKAGDHTRRAAGVADVHDRAVVGRVDAQAGVQSAGRGATDEQRHRETGALHLGGDAHHLVERRGDEAGQADDVDVALASRLENRLGGHHHAEVDDLVVGAAEHHADDVLSDVVHVALHGGEQHGAGLRSGAVFTLGFDERCEIGHRLLHHAGRLHDLREEHPARAEQVADGVHPAHQRALDHVDGAARSSASLFHVGLDEHGDAVDQGMVDAAGDVPRPPLLHGRISGLLAGAGEADGGVEEPLGRVVTTSEHHVLAELAQFSVDLVIDGELAGVDDSQAHTGFDGAQQEHRVHGLTNRLVASERERQIGDATGDVDVGQLVGDQLDGFEEVEAVAVVLVDASGDGKDVGVDDDVVGREADLVDQQVVCPPGDRHLALDRVGLADFVEGHHDHRCAIVEARASLGQERLFALLHRDRVDDRLALHALQAGLDHLELRRVDHDRHAGDVGLRRNEIEERGHRLDAVDQAVVHVDVDDLRAALDLLERDHERFAVLVVLDQPTELGRAGDVGALADVDERDVVGECERFEAGQLQTRGAIGDDAWRLGLDGMGDRFDVGRCRATTAADHVEEAGAGELADERCGFGRGLVVAAEFVGEPGVRVGADERVGDGGELEEVRTHLLGTERTVEAHGQGLSVADRLPERCGGLARQRAPGPVGDRSRDHQRKLGAVGRHRPATRHDCCLGVERVEDRLDQDDVDAAAQERLDLLLIRVGEAGERDGSVAGVLDLGRQRERHVGGADSAGDEAAATVGAVGFFGSLAGEPCGNLVEFDDLVDSAVVALRHTVGRKGVGLDDVGAGEEIAQMDVAHRVGLGEGQQLVVAAEIMTVVAEAVTTERVVGQAECLDLGAHRTVEHDDALAGEQGDRVVVERVRVGAHIRRLPSSCDFLDGVAVACEPDGDGESVVAGGRIDVDDGRAVEPDLVEPVAELIVGETEAAVGGGPEEVVTMWGEIDDEQPSARRNEPPRLGECPGGVVEVMQHLVDDDEIERCTLQRRAVHVALAELPTLHAEAFEICACNRQHRVAGIETDRAVGALGEELQHPTRAGADVEHATERAIADHIEDHSLDRGCGSVQRSFLVPDRGDPFEVLAGRVGPAAAHEVEPFEIGGDHGVGRVDGGERRGEEREVSADVDDPEEGPGAFAMFGDEAGVDEESEVTRHAWLRLPQDFGEIGDGEFAVTQHGEDPQPGLLGNRPQRIERRLHQHSRSI